MSVFIVPVVVAVVATLGSYLAASRRLSGRIATSEAASLWEESRSIREEYRERLAAAEARQAKLEERMADMEQLNLKLSRENSELKIRNRELVQLCERLQDKIDQLVRENRSLKETIRKVIGSDAEP